MTDQSPRGGLRQVQRRAAVFEDTEPYVVSNDYAAADLETARASAVWGDPIDVKGRDSVTLFVDFTKVTGQTGLVLACQDGASDGKAASEWYDRHATFSGEVGTATVIPATPLDLTLDVSGFADGAHRISLSLLIRANWLRVKPYGAGTVTGSRCTIRAVRILRAS